MMLINGWADAAVSRWADLGYVGHASVDERVEQGLGRDLDWSIQGGDFFTTCTALPAIDLPPCVLMGLKMSGVEPPFPISSLFP